MKERSQLLLLLGAGLALRLPVMSAAGYVDDVRLYELWSWKAATLGIHTLYQHTAGVVSDNHPGCLYPFKLIGWVYQALAGGAFPYPETSSPLHIFLLRFPAVICDLLIGLLVYLWTRRRLSHAAAAAAAAAFIFNPGVIFDSAVYGQTDSIHTLLTLGAFLLVTQRREAWAWGLMGLAMMTKPQTYVLVPLLALVTIRRSGWRTLGLGAAAAAGTALLTASPFVLWGGFSGLARHLLTITEVHPVVSANADNLWWLLFRGSSFFTPDTGPVPLLGGTVDFRTVGLALLLALHVPVWREAWRCPDPPNVHFLAAGSAGLCEGPGFEEGPTKVYAIAYTADAFYVAEDIVKKKGWLVTSPSDSELVLAIAQDTQINPLRDAYGSWKELEEDVKEHTRKDGAHFIIYTYEINNDKSLELKDYTYKKTFLIRTVE